MHTPLIYLADPQTLEYLGTSYADPDPLDPDNWLIPAAAFLDAPPEAKAGFSIRRSQNGAEWEVVIDNRGVIYSTITGLEQMLAELGDVPAGFTSKPYPGPFHHWNGEEWELNEEASRAAAVNDAHTERDRLLREAAIRIAPLQDAIDLGEASATEEAALLAWKRYRVQLNRIEQLPGYPASIEWPASPVANNEAASATR